MTTLEKLDRAVIEAIHGKPYEKACLTEIAFVWGYDSESEVKECMVDEGHTYDYYSDEMPPITIGRVMQALGDKVDYLEFQYVDGMLRISNSRCAGPESTHGIEAEWKQNKGNKQLSTTADQTEETQKALLQLIKPSCT